MSEMKFLNIISKTSSSTWSTSVSTWAMEEKGPWLIMAYTGLYCIYTTQLSKDYNQLQGSLWNNQHNWKYPAVLFFVAHNVFVFAAWNAVNVFVAEDIMHISMSW